jgi:hypothetical protein
LTNKIVRRSQGKLSAINQSYPSSASFFPLSRALIKMAVQGDDVALIDV